MACVGAAYTSCWRERAVYVEEADCVFHRTLVERWHNAGRGSCSGSHCIVCALVAGFSTMARMIYPVPATGFQWLYVVGTPA